MMGKYRFQALKARNSKAQGEGCKAAETVGERRRNAKPCEGETDRGIALKGRIGDYANNPGLAASRFQLAPLTSIAVDK
jgi:hypothetical protein